MYNQLPDLAFARSLDPFADQAFAMRWLAGVLRAWSKAIHLVSMIRRAGARSAGASGRAACTAVWSALNDWLHVDALAAVFPADHRSWWAFWLGLYSIGYIRHDL